jgi:hypothetical protein
MRKKIFISCGILAVGMTAVFLIVYSFLPNKHLAHQHIFLEVEPQAIWNVITDPSKYTEWRKEIKAVEIDPDESNLLGWIEISKDDKKIKFLEREVEAPYRWVIIVDEINAQFSGSWTFSLQEKAAGTFVLITEAGTISNSFVRLYRSLFLKPEANIETYLKDLSWHFGEEINF